VQPNILGWLRGIMLALFSWIGGGIDCGLRAEFCSARNFDMEGRARGHWGWINRKFIRHILTQPPFGLATSHLFTFYIPGAIYRELIFARFWVLVCFPVSPVGWAELDLPKAKPIYTPLAGILLGVVSFGLMPDALAALFSVGRSGAAMAF